jgi:hypothetical protein
MMKSALILALALAGWPGATPAQDLGSQAVAYCADLKRVTALAMTKERFASIAGRPRDGNFLETSLALTGWNDCSLYGPGTYTCDSQALATAQATEPAQAATLRDIMTCLGEGWAEAADRGSTGYVVLHSLARPVSITLSTDRTDKGEHVVRLILFVRRN